VLKSSTWLGSVHSLIVLQTRMFAKVLSHVSHDVMMPIWLKEGSVLVHDAWMRMCEGSCTRSFLQAHVNSKKYQELVRQSGQPAPAPVIMIRQLDKEQEPAAAAAAAKGKATAFLIVVALQVMHWRRWCEGLWG